MTVVERATRCILGIEVVKIRTLENMQSCLDQGPRAKEYHSDAFGLYYLLSYYPGYHYMHKDKSETFSVESV